MKGHHLAELNVGRLLAPVGDPRVAEFIDNIERINNLGKRMPGFVWMLEGSVIHICNPLLFWHHVFRPISADYLLRIVIYYRLRVCHLPVK